MASGIDGHRPLILRRRVRPPRKGRLVACIRNSALALGALFSITALILFRKNRLVRNRRRVVIHRGNVPAPKRLVRSRSPRALHPRHVPDPARFRRAAGRISPARLQPDLDFLEDLAAHLTFPNPRPLAWLIRIAGALTALANYGFLFLQFGSVHCGFRLRPLRASLPDREPADR